MFSKSLILEEGEGAFHPNTDLAVGMEAERVGDPSKAMWLISATQDLGSHLEDTRGA